MMGIKWRFGVLLLFCFCIVSCGVSKNKTIDTVPLLQYDCMQDALYYMEWDLLQNRLTVQQGPLLRQEDVTKIYEMEWNGKDTLVLPNTFGTTPFTDINSDVFPLVVQKRYENEIIRERWHCWKAADDAFMLMDEQDQYTLTMDQEYVLCGLLESQDDVILLLTSQINGDTVLYRYDTTVQSGTIQPVSGFRTLMFSQIIPEQAAVETDTGFYFTDGYEVYFVDGDTAKAQLVFSKNDLAESKESSDAMLANQLYSCNISIGVYQDNLLVKLRDNELLLPSQWLYCQQGEQEYLLELPEDEKIYRFPNLQ